METGVITEGVEYMTLKEEGNKAFKDNKWEEALKHYNSALKHVPDFSTEKAVILKNRAAVYLKLGQFNNAVESCTSSLDIVPDDPKALFRRCQALESLERFEEAYRDARMVHKVDPTNKSIQPFLTRLHSIVEERNTQNIQLENKVQQMFRYVFDIAADKDKRIKAVSNLVVLSKEASGCKALLSAGVVEKICQLLKVEKLEEIILGCIRTVGQICKQDAPNTKRVISVLGIPWFLDMINNRNEEHVNAAQYCVQAIICSLTGIGMTKDKKPDPELLQEYKTEIDTLLTCLLYGCTSRSITGIARDAIIQLISRNVHYKAINWAEELVKIKGLQRLMEVASELQEFKYESAMEITESTRYLTSVCLARIYENMYYDEARARFLENIEDFVKSKLITPEIESKVRVVAALTTLLLGALDVGNTIISKDGMLQMILVMAGTDDVLQQKVACECIIAAATKKDKVKSIISQGVNILKQLYHSKDDGIRVRALVGLCKLGSSGGTDASIRPFADGATSRLADACKKFLINPSKDKDLRRWAADGLSYLTLDADVKEKLVNDKAALKALFELARSGNQAAVFGVVTTFVNLVNAYDKQEILPELIEMAKFAKHHIPEDHELDDPDFVAQRCTCLVHEGIVSALVALVKAESQNCREMIARVFCTLASQQELRGIIVQQGGVKALLQLTHDGTDKGMKQAAQALARVGITLDPSVAFSGQRNMEVIKPLLSLLQPDCNALENFEALLALCNLASMNEAVRNHIIKEGGISKIEAMMYEEHEMIRRAATQVMTNMMTSEKVIKLYEGENDRTKFMFLLCGEEDEETMKAAAGAMAILTSASEICCKKIIQVQSWLETLHMILAHENVEIQHRAVVIVNNMISCDRELAEKVIETDIMEILMAFTVLDDDSRAILKQVSQEGLNAAKKWNIIKPVEEAENE
ncbi:protein unc-45 homolog B [Cimex lectularius]|uniref:Protein unc-45 homolog B n=1 Tax=Cimex lectularius TaxID=79782 RepID=A0A8I6TD77_CIMLE|nr:protein unc-45 homolog B [Cimex lectularius]